MTLQTFANTVRILGQRIAGLEHTVRVYREELRFKEASIVLEVAKERDKYPNERTREAAIALELEQVSSEIRSRLLKAEFDLSAARYEIEAAKLDFKQWQLEKLHDIANTQGLEFFQQGGVL